jgi:16S rRNA U516 pseudouridylate synthase RsuA-like enzyme
MFDTIGHSVVKLRRTAIGRISDKMLRTGEFRKLTLEEIETFKTPSAKGASKHR